MLIVSRIDMIFKGLFVIFAIATLGDIPSANKGINPYSLVGILNQIGHYDLTRVFF